MDDIAYIVTGWVVGCGLLAIGWMVAAFYKAGGYRFPGPTSPSPDAPPRPGFPDYVPEWLDDEAVVREP